MTMTSILLKSNNFIALFENEEWLADCLKHSPVGQVHLAPDLGEAKLSLWANACKRANKQAFLQIPGDGNLPEGQKALRWQLKRLCDWIAAFFLLSVLSPIFLGLALLIRLTSPGQILFRQWRVGQGGQLFEIFKFRTMVVGAEKLHYQVMCDCQGLHKRENDPRLHRLGGWMRKYSLDELPQLFNVLRGEMSLVGPRPWALYDALRISPAGWKRLNALPGITGFWQVEARSKLLDLEAVTDCDLQYLRDWSLGKDFAILLKTIPCVLSGFGAV